MIEKIYIPTVHRVHNQIMYNNLPHELKNRVVMVVQAWERAQYTYDCEYLVLPDTNDYHYSNHLCIANTRLLIYHTAQHSKYAIIDDDIQFYRRNSKYATGISNMERAARKCTEQDIREMFALYSRWLDEPSVTVAGCSFTDNPPARKPFSNNGSLSSALWINGHDFAHELGLWILNNVSVAEDTNFLLTLLTNGYGNRVSQEFSIFNTSAEKKHMPSAVWDNKTHAHVHEAHKTIARNFPGIFIVLYDDDGNRLAGGFRNFGKTKTRWSKAFNKLRHDTIVKPRLTKTTTAE